MFKNNIKQQTRENIITIGLNKSHARIDRQNLEHKTPSLPIRNLLHIIAVHIKR